ncbi:hypothetical protein [Nonomuraea gerenzanensis]|uniref:Secreted protein n=1 Tax=Nonomuraea gerenzanensis TaxID=93944 RepID=A0A1M4E9E9_9ACTN|nr:hypothetical protein [Nonomuraea gerenzanensis]UBU17761.1 hypothetical protein LCN96_22875 [Nonomuraea gerenzanensis]SBO95539.1 hypothetical protein BN4615_P5055 [Nonomuraea gerenzanensis]
MNQTRKMWASAAVVGVIVAGGASVAAAASAGKLDQVARETRAVVEKASPSGQPAPETTDDGVVVSTEVNPDPREVIEYWSDERMEDAEPMPMPEVSPGEFGVGSDEIQPGPGEPGLTE